MSLSELLSVFVFVIIVFAILCYFGSKTIYVVKQKNYNYHKLNVMHSIKLKKKHREKLLHMCNNLFPEYTNGGSVSLETPYVIYGNEYIQMNKNHTFIQGFEIDNDNLGDPDLYMHWFEFCITKLAPKLLKSDGIVVKFDGQYNPIDFLYEQFIKQKR